MALKNSTDRGALERLLLSRLPRKEISTLVQSYTQPYRELMSYYRCAMMEVETKFNVLNEELSLQYDRNPIESIKTRLKSPESIAEKLQRRGFPLTVVLRALTHVIFATIGASISYRMTVGLSASFLTMRYIA